MVAYQHKVAYKRTMKFLPINVFFSPNFFFSFPGLLTRTFFCLGFELVTPDHLLASMAGDFRVMVYPIQQIHPPEE